MRRVWAFLVACVASGCAGAGGVGPVTEPHQAGRPMTQADSLVADVRTAYEHLRSLTADPRASSVTSCRVEVLDACESPVVYSVERADSTRVGRAAQRVRDANGAYRRSALDLGLPQAPVCGPVVVPPVVLVDGRCAFDWYGSRSDGRG